MPQSAFDFFVGRADEEPAALFVDENHRGRVIAENFDRLDAGGARSDGAAGWRARRRDEKCEGQRRGGAERHRQPRSERPPTSGALRTGRGATAEPATNLVPLAQGVGHGSLLGSGPPHREGGREVVSDPPAIGTVRDMLVEGGASAGSGRAVSFGKDPIVSLAAVHDEGGKIGGDQRRQPSRRS